MLFLSQIDDNITSILMTYIILFSSDFVQLENKKVIEKIQVNFLLILFTTKYSIPFFIFPIFSSITWSC